MLASFIFESFFFFLDSFSENVTKCAADGCSWGVLNLDDWYS